MSVILQELNKSDMSSEEDVEEHSDLEEWNLGQNEPEENSDGTQYFKEVRYVMFVYVICYKFEQITHVQTMPNCAVVIL